MSDIVDIPQVEFGDTGVVVLGKLSFKDWLKGTESLLKQQKKTMWWIGDLLLYGEREYHDNYTQAVDPTDDYAVETARSAEYVARNIPTEIRRPDLSWSAHRAAARLDTFEQKKAFIAEAAEQRYTKQQAFERSNEIKPMIRRKTACDPGHTTKSLPPVQVPTAHPQVQISTPNPSLQDRMFLLLGALLDRMTPGEIAEFEDICKGAERDVPTRARLAVTDIVISPSLKREKGIVKGKQEIFGEAQIREFDCLDSEEFRAAWSKWHEHRKEIKKPLTMHSACEQLKWLASQKNAVACIDFTIRKGWQGLREPEYGAANGRNVNIQTIAQRAMQEAGFVE